MKYFKFPPTVYNESRTFSVNYTGVRNEQERLKFPSNFIKTSRYNIVTFLPVALLRQFARYANIYFLVIAVIQSISIISPLNPFSAIAPLVFVLGLSMLREGYEDILRHKSDDEVNASPTYVHQNCKEERTTWTNIMVGDLVFVEENDPFPADLIVFGSSIESGVCYIETSSLDGEKNLKPKSALKETQELFARKEAYEQHEISMDAQPPSQALYEYEGSVQLPNKKYIVGPKQLLLRGAYLRNTKWIIGAVVYTGQDSKIMRNAEPGRIKQSAIESQMNSLILSILMIQMALCIVSAALNSAWQHQKRENHWYLAYSDEDYSEDLTAFIVFFSYFLLYNTMIPISLIVSLEFVKVFQSYFIGTDEEMYVAARDKYASVKTTTINEELGQVEYIFSDKTGTLTCNQMEFKYCIIGDVLYGREEPQNLKGDKSTSRLQYKNQQSMATIHPETGKKQEPGQHQHSIFNFHDQELEGVIQGKVDAAKYARNLNLTSKDGKTTVTLQTQKELVHYYFFLLCSAHECIFQLDKNNQPMYQGPSPDEITLVDAAAHMGFKFLGSSASEQTFDILGEKKKVELKFLFEFDSDRKRMSVIIRDNGVYKLMVKGADSIIKSRLSKEKEQLYLPYIETELDNFSRIGLRCLLMATKVLSESEYKVFEAACNAVIDSPTRNQDLLKLTDELERDLYLIGATAVEDKLQPQVPETIADFLRANIKVWMLTGDKLETAENIAKSCRLIQGDMTVMRIAEKTLAETIQKLQDNKETFDLCVKQGRKKSLLVDGDSLAILLANPENIPLFVSIAQECESVVCCRVTPKQKAQVVKLIKDNLNKITLAIGDGANDVNMIQEAHIGIGLYGNEGMRAVQSSDFALGEFRCLWRLLLVHGHWSYIRISEMILYFFYKNMIFTVPQFFFAFFSAYSAQSVFDDWYITFYNMLFTALPLIIRATFDQDLNYRTRTEYSSDPELRRLQKKEEQYLKNKFPLLYYVGQQKTIFTVPNFIFWAFQGAIHGLIVFFGGYGCFTYSAVHKTGFTMDQAGFGITLLTAIIFIVDIKIALFTKFWTWLNFISLFVFSILLYYIYMLFSQTIIGTLSLYTPFTLFLTPHFWLLIIVLSGVVFLYDLVQGQIVREIFKSETDNLRVFVKHFDRGLQQWQQSHMQESTHAKVPNNKHIAAQINGSFWEEVLKEEDKQPMAQEEGENNIARQPQQGMIV